MATAAEVQDHLPSLRRFARALTGTQKSGDDLVQLVLEALIQNPKLDPSKPIKFCLFEQLYRAWADTKPSPSIDDGDTERAPKSVADVRLSAMPDDARYAFLLVGLEKFSPTQGAEITGHNVDTFESLLERARRVVAQQIGCEILIIEDDLFIAEHLKNLMTDLGHTVVGIARSHQSAVDLFSRHQPQIILTDVHLDDGSSGIDAASDIRSLRDTQVIFITASPDRVLSGRHSEPAFVIGKPFDPDEVQSIVSQVLYFKTNTNPALSRSCS